MPLATQVSASTNPTMIDIGNSLGKDAPMGIVINQLTERNDFIGDMTMIKGNLKLGHTYTLRTSLPTGKWRKWYGGVAPGKTSTVKITDTCGNLEAYSECDYDQYRLEGGDSAGGKLWRMNQDGVWAEGLGQQVASQMFYGDEKLVPESFTGLAPRYNDLKSTSPIHRNIADAGGRRSSNASIWIVCWSPRTVHGIYPSIATGGAGGLTMEDLGRQVSESRSADGGGYMQVMLSHYQWQLGLSVGDWRAVYRICNIDRDVLEAADGGTTLNPATGLPRDVDIDGTSYTVPLLHRLVNKGLVRLADVMPGTRVAIYMDAEIQSYFDAQATNTLHGSSLQYENVGGTMVEGAMQGGKMQITYKGYPIRICNTLLRNESRVTA